MFGHWPEATARHQPRQPSHSVGLPRKLPGLLPCPPPPRHQEVRTPKLGKGGGTPQPGKSGGSHSGASLCRSCLSSSPPARGAEREGQGEEGSREKACRIMCICHLVQHASLCCVLHSPVREETTALTTTSSPRNSTVLHVYSLQYTTNASFLLSDEHILTPDIDGVPHMSSASRLATLHFQCP